MFDVGLVNVFVTAGLCALTFLLGMRVEVRGPQGIVEDVKAFNAKLLEEFEKIKTQIESLHNKPITVAPVTPTVTVNAPAI